ncbi:MAG TPA: AsmA family protein, partial [Longimicrobiales bacterium]|nr:AsmA family protein [Longimicrobiales bacterium]
MKDSGRTRTLRIIAWAGGGALAVVLAAALAVALLFPAGRIGAMAAERASAALDREVTVDAIRLRIFPLPAVALEGVTVSRWRQSEAARNPGVTAEPGNSLPLVQVERVDVRPRLLPLLTGNIVIHAVVIDRPRVAVEIEGEASPDLEEARQGAPGFWEDADFQIRSIRVRDGVVTYHDSRTGTELRLEGLNQELRLEGELEAGELARLRLTGHFDAAAFDASIPAHLATPVRDARLVVEHDATLDIAGRNAEIARLAVTFQELTLQGSGTVTAWSDPEARRVALRLESGDVDAATLVASLPEKWRSLQREGEASPRVLSAPGGTFRVRADATGRLGNGEVPDVNGAVELDAIAVALDGRTVLDDLRGRLDFSLDSASTPGLEGRLFNEPLRATFVARDLADPEVGATLSTRLSLDDVAALGFLPAGWSATGRVPVELAIDGKPLEPRSMVVSGIIEPAGASVRAPDWTAPLTIRSGSVALGGRDISGQGLGATIGESDVAVDFSMSDWLGFALGDTLATPHLAFDLRSSRFDADAVMPGDPSKPTYTELLFARLTGREVGGRSAGEAAEAAGLRLPDLPDLALDGYVQVGELRRKGASFQDLDVAIS